MIQIYHNNRCTKSRQALEALETSRKAFEVIYYLETPPDLLQLKGLIEKLGVKPIELIRKTEKIYLEKYKNKSLSDEAWLEAMVQHSILIERPIVVSGNQAVVARPLEKINELLK
ncbi:arsenate reductase (glutaredoxin) [Pedobacter agri]|uniref:Arsenate reductase (Glutaredoxin) n=1 Tax=Pedobacter agri TaxID=454586 RepID=A0A9X3I6Y3_9SPHI|nr:arsenate reductase (glutaredoxin) [Pedobacter agri]MCX3263202.1 arsenate reductase (glutaredoxin) [Pedobacter agri]